MGLSQSSRFGGNSPTTASTTGGTNQVAPANPTSLSGGFGVDTSGVNLNVQLGAVAALVLTFAFLGYTWWVK